MPKKKTAISTKKASLGKKTSVDSSPVFPYSNKPNSLRKFLEQIPRKPKPPKINVTVLKAWDLKDTNDQSIIRVLKALGFVGSNNEPTERYVEFMTPGKGPAVLAQAIREVWAPLFTHSHQPHKEDDNTLKNYFHIHSGGSERTIAFQIQTFKSACDHADFGASLPTTPNSADSSSPGSITSSKIGVGSNSGPALHIDLHIHLPENKSRRDYEYIFEDIAKYIFGRNIDSNTNE